MVTMRTTRYERVEIDEVQYLVCAECRYPVHSDKGYCVCYPVPIPGVPHGQEGGQSLCKKCYLMQYKRLYPTDPLPVLEENLLENWDEPISFGGIDLTQSTDEIIKQKKDLDMHHLEELIAKGRQEQEQRERMLRELQGEGYDGIGELTVSYRE